MLRRFFCDQPIRGETATLQGGDCQHLTRVLRQGPGDAVLLFDGSGAEFLAVIEQTARDRVVLRICERREVSREPPRQLVLAVALPKGERQRWLVEKAVELGVARLVPLRAERAVAQPAGHVLDRLRRHVIEASKQCGRNRLMQIDPPQTLPELESAWSGPGLLLLADPHGPAIPLSQLPRPAAEHPACVAIGPEGGFSDQERQAAAAWQRIGLGDRILRVETAALAVAAWFALADPPRP